MECLLLIFRVEFWIPNKRSFQQTLTDSHLFWMMIFNSEGHHNGVIVLARLKLTIRQCSAADSLKITLTDAYQNGHENRLIRCARQTFKVLKIIIIVITLIGPVITTTRLLALHWLAGATTESQIKHHEIAPQSLNHFSPFRFSFERSQRNMWGSNWD